MSIPDLARKLLEAVETPEGVAKRQEVLDTEVDENLVLALEILAGMEIEEIDKRWLPVS